MPFYFVRANIRFFIFSEQKLPDIFVKKEVRKFPVSGFLLTSPFLIFSLLYSTNPLFFKRYTGLGSAPRNFL